MHTGEGTSMVWPVGERLPVAGSMWKTTMLFDSWFSARRYIPVGSMAKWRGVLPPVKTCPRDFSVPFFSSMAKTAMLSWPRFDAYRNFPEGSTAISAVVFEPEKSFGRVEMICKDERVPFLA